MPAAARLGDFHECPSLDPGPIPHVGGAILPPCSPDTFVNSLGQARVTDRLQCLTPAPNFIVTGSGSVSVNGLPAARKGDKTMHPPPGEILTGSADVEIGGPTVGATLGAPAAGNAACQAAAAGRKSGSTQQSYQNCGVESSRQIINQATGAKVSEDALLDSAEQNGDAERARNRADSGGTYASGRQNILAQHGVGSTLTDGTMANITQAVAEKRGVITSHDVAILWGPGNSGGHAIVVTGVEYDANGNPLNVIVNDTGLGICQNSVPADQFAASLLPGTPANVTTAPIW